MNRKKLTGTRIGIDDFISPDTNVPESKVFKDDRILAFSNIRVGIIDPRISTEVLSLTKKIRETLKRIKDM